MVSLIRSQFKAKIGVLGDTSQLDLHALEAQEHVKKVIRVQEPYKKR